MQRHAHTVDRARHTECDPLDTVPPLTEALARDTHTTLGNEVVLTAPRQVIAVCMRDDRARHGAPRVDEEIAFFTVESGFGDTKHAGRLCIEGSSETDADGVTR